MHKIDIKPMSVNAAWQGKRFKSAAYKQYELELSFLLPALEIPEGKLFLSIEAGISALSDIDNISKSFVDVLQKVYGFNDKDIMLLHLHKVIVKRGHEYISFKFEKYPC